MTTNFFTTLAGLDIKAGWKINILNSPDNKLVVSVLFFDGKLEEKALSRLTPLQMTGTAEELDNAFFATIEAPAKETAELFNNVANYRKVLAEAKKNTQQEKDKKEKDREKEKKPEPAKTKTFDSEMKKVDELVAKEKFAEALLQLPKADAFPDKVQEIEAKREELWALQDKKSNTLFQ